MSQISDNTNVKISELGVTVNTDRKDVDIDSESNNGKTKKDFGTSYNQQYDDQQRVEVRKDRHEEEEKSSKSNSRSSSYERYKKRK